MKYGRLLVVALLVSMFFPGLASAATTVEKLDADGCSGTGTCNLSGLQTINNAQDVSIPKNSEEYVTFSNSSYTNDKHLKSVKFYVRHSGEAGINGNLEITFMNEAQTVTYCSYPSSIANTEAWTLDALDTSIAACGWDEARLDDLKAEIYNGDTQAGDDAFIDYVNVTVEYADPVQVTIVSPDNITYGTDSVDLNVTADQPADMWKYSLDGAANVTFTPNTTLAGLADGPHNVTVWANSTDGAEDTETAYFTVDTTPPLITILSPENKSYSTTMIWLNVSAGEPVDTWRYSLDGSSNTTFTPNITLTETKQHSDSVTPIEHANTRLDTTLLTAGQVSDITSDDGTTFAVTGVATLTVELSSTTESVDALNNASCYLNYDSEKNAAGVFSVYDSYAGAQLASVSLTELQTDATVAVTDLHTKGLNASEVSTMVVYVDSTVNNKDVLIDALWCDVDYNTTLLYDGQHNVTVYANDTLGNENSSTVWFSVDTSIPVINISSPENKTYASDTVWLNVSADKAVDAWWYSLDSGSNVSFEPNTTISGLSDGLHNVTVWANGSSGGENSSSVWFSVDLSPPAINITSPENKTYPSSSVSLSYTADDALSNVSACWYSLDSSSNISITEMPIMTFVKETADTYEVTNGSYGAGSLSSLWSVDADYLRVNEEGDGLGLQINFSSVSSSIGVWNISFYGQHKGTNTHWINVNIWNYTNNSWSMVNMIPSGTTDDWVNTSSLKTEDIVQNSLMRVWLLHNDVSFKTAHYLNVDYLALEGEHESGDFNCTATLSSLSDGSHNVTAYADDTFGSTNSSTVLFSVDTIVPSIRFVPPTDPDKAFVNRTWSFVNLSVQDDNIDTVILNWNGVNQTLTIPYINMTALADGTHKYYAWVNDTAGNSNKTEMRKLNVDTTPPSVTINSPLNMTYDVSSVLFNATVTDFTAVYTVVVEYDGQNHTMSQSGSTWTHYNSSVPDGYYTARFYANDTLGWMNSTEAVYFAVDTTPPNITLDYPANGSILTQGDIINMTITDAIAFSAWWSNDSGATNYTEWIGSHDVNTSNWTVEATKHFWVWAQDSSGYMSTRKYQFIMDQTPPEILVTSVTPKKADQDSPVNVTVTANVTDAISPVDKVWFEVQLPDESAVETVFLANSCGPSCYSGSWDTTGYGIGLYYIDVWANDTIGNANETENIATVTITKLLLVSASLNDSIVNPSDAVMLTGRASYVNGTGLSSIAVEVRLDNTLLGTAPTNGTGHYSYALAAPSTLGGHEIRVNTSDVNGNKARASASFSVRELVFDLLSFRDSKESLDNTLEPGEEYMYAVRIREFDSFSLYPVTGGAFNMTVNSADYAMSYDAAAGRWLTVDSFTAPVERGVYVDVTATVYGASANGIKGTSQVLELSQARAPVPGEAENVYVTRYPVTVMDRFGRATIGYITIGVWR